MGSPVEKDEPTPPNLPDVAVLTPDQASTGSSQRQAKESQGIDLSGQTPSVIVSGREFVALDMLRNNGRGLSLRDLYDLKRDSRRLNSEGDFRFAETKLRNVLGGFRHCLDPTQPVVADSAYALASCLAGQHC